MINVSFGRASHYGWGLRLKVILCIYNLFFQRENLAMHIPFQFAWSCKDNHKSLHIHMEWQLMYFYKYAVPSYMSKHCGKQCYVLFDEQKISCWIGLLQGETGIQDTNIWYYFMLIILCWLCGQWNPNKRSKAQIPKVFNKNTYIWWIMPSHVFFCLLWQQGI